MANREGSLTRAVVALFAILLVGLSLGARAQQAPGPSADDQFASQYLIGAGDVLQIFVWRQEDLSVTVPVRPDGKISTPLIDDLVAVGKTPTQLAREMEQALAQYLRSPQVNVIVKEFVGMAGAQIRVTGQALEPKLVPYRDRMTLLDVIIAVGGLTDFAAGNRSRIVRNVDGKSEEIRVKLDDLVNKGKIANNIPMRPGDILIIPERVF